MGSLATSPSISSLATNSVALWGSLLDSFFQCEDKAQNNPSFHMGPYAENVGKYPEFSGAELLLWPPAPILGFRYYHTSPSLPWVAGTTRGRRLCPAEGTRACPLLTPGREAMAAPRSKGVQLTPGHHKRRMAEWAA